METFQKIVLYTAIIILLVALVFVGFSLSYSKSNKPWPPVLPECPDYWTIDGSGNNAVCINVGEKILSTGETVSRTTARNTKKQL